MFLGFIVQMASGDARNSLNALELALVTTPPGKDGVVVVDLTVAEESIQQRALLYDKDGDIHYDMISAFIKSLRGSDPDAALYWMARMIRAGEDPACAGGSRPSGKPPSAPPRRSSGQRK